MVDPRGSGGQPEVAALRFALIALTRQVQGNARSLDQCRDRLDGLVRSASWLTAAKVAEMVDMLSTESEEVGALEARLNWLIKHVGDLEKRH